MYIFHYSIQDIVSFDYLIIEKFKENIDLYKEINRHLNSIDDSLKTLLWVQSAQLLINRKNMKKLSDTTSRMMSQLGSLSLNDDNSINDKNEVPDNALWNGNDD